MKKTLLIMFFFALTLFSQAQTVIDVDGNIYHTVTIGSQTWMVENLKTTKYNDGDSIPNVTDATKWGTLTTPGVCTYNNTRNTDTINTYGRLYNWYAVNTGKLAPKGWHVSTTAEWDTLENYLVTNGYNFDGTTTGDRDSNNKFAKALASASGWHSDPDNGIGVIGNVDYPDKRNATGFTALPGGFRGLSDVKFYSICYYGYWWSSSEKSTTHAWYRYMAYYYSCVILNIYPKSSGFSVRCVKDNIANSINNPSFHNEINLYPNPTNGILYFSNNTNSCFVTIYDSKGKILMSKILDNNTIDISGFQNGIYLIKIIDSDRITINKVIKQ